MKTRSWQFLTLLLAICLISASPALAGVSLRNGNFFISYTDIAPPGGPERFEIERVYNSKSPHKGFFGWGWGAIFETSLAVQPDGTVELTEWGGGAGNRFTPPAPDAGEIGRAAASIVDAARQAGILAEADVPAYRSRLVSDAVYRDDEWGKFLKTGLVKARTVPAGTRLVSMRFGQEILTRVEGGYTREKGNGEVFHFDDSGRLVRIGERHGRFVALHYDAKGRLARLKDERGREIRLSLNPKGLVETIHGSDGRAAHYRYNERSELVYSKDVDGNEYTYAYDAGGRHNMVRIGYKDKTSLTVSYYGREAQENVRSVKHPGGLIEEYAYQSDPDKGLTQVTVRRTGKDGFTEPEDRHEFHEARRADGSTWLRESVEFAGSTTTVRTYDGRCDAPIRVQVGDEVATYEHDQHCRMTRMSMPNGGEEWQYGAGHNKPVRIIRYDLPGGENRVTYDYAYDTTGNLSEARSSRGDAVRLRHDAKGRIVHIEDQAGIEIDGKASPLELEFKYVGLGNQLGKPTEIAVRGVGIIHVSYNPDASIRSIKTTGSKGVSDLVSGVFSLIRELIRPVGESLGL